MLLVICRPGGREDVPFRSVASRLVRGGADQMEGLDLDVLRPASFARLARCCTRPPDAGRPYHVVHFDGHGTYLDLTDRPRDAAAALSHRAGGGGGSGSPLRYGVSVAGPVRAGPHGYLIFEDPDHDENQQLVDGPAMGRLLDRHRRAGAGAERLPVRLRRSPRPARMLRPTMPIAPPGDGDTADAGRWRMCMPGSGRTGRWPPRSPTPGCPGWWPCAYNVYVVTAAQFVADLYAHLLSRPVAGPGGHRRPPGAGRLTRSGRSAAVPVALQDWVVPVVYEAAPLTLLRPGPRRAAADPADRSGEDGARRGRRRAAAAAGCGVLRPG